MADTEDKKATKPEKSQRPPSAEQATKAAKDDKKAAKQARADKGTVDAKAGKPAAPREPEVRVPARLKVQFEEAIRSKLAEQFGYKNRFEVPVMTRDGEPIARFSYPGKDSGRLDWTGDGKSILTSRQEKSGWRIWRTDLATPDRSVPISAFGWRDPRVHGTMLFAEKDGVAGIWRIDGTPHRLTDGPPPEASDVYTIAGDRLIYSDTTDPDHPTFSAQNIHGGPKDRLAPLPGFYANFVFGVDPKNGDIIYTQKADDTDIGLLRLVKR